MTSSALPRPLAALVAALAAVLAVSVLPALSTAADAAPVASSAAAPSGRVRGEIIGAGSLRVKVSWFTTDWRYLGARRVSGGGYSLTLPPGTYRLQFSDQRPAYDLAKFAPVDAVVRVVAGRTSMRSVRMRPGAAIGGTVKAGGKVAPYARIVAASADQRSFETQADRRGNFALGGLPAASYSVFTYDRNARWTARSTYLRNLKPRSYTPVAVKLNTRAGTLLVDLYTPTGPYRGAKVFPTVVSRSTGQFWTGRSSGGTVTFRGLAPGRYRLQLPWLGSYLPVTVNLPSAVRPGRASFASVRVTRRGGWVTGTAVDANRPENVLINARVRLYDRAGSLLDETTSNGAGRFTLDGRLTTQRGLTVVVGPSRDTPWVNSTSSDSLCKYRDSRRTGVAITTGRQTEIGDVGVAHLPDASQENKQACYTPAPTTEQPEGASQ